MELVLTLFPNQFAKAKCLELFSNYFLDKIRFEKYDKVAISSLGRRVSIQTSIQSCYYKICLKEVDLGFNLSCFQIIFWQTIRENLMIFFRNSERMKKKTNNHSTTLSNQDHSKVEKNY
jgi:hypothetical protein